LRRVLVQGGDVGGCNADGAALAAAPSYAGRQLLDALAGLALAFGQFAEDEALAGVERLAHGGDEQRAPRLPSVAAQGRAEEALVGEGAAQWDARDHAAAL
jgi:hypothetical protein